MDVENILYKPSCNSLNDTLKSLLTKKHESARKTFGLFTEIKPTRKMHFDLPSERLDFNSKYLFIKLRFTKISSREKETSLLKF
jgi:hypothetical protein